MYSYFFTISSSVSGLSVAINTPTHATSITAISETRIFLVFLSFCETVSVIVSLKSKSLSIYANAGVPAIRKYAIDF